MNRAKAVLFSIRFANSVRSTQFRRAISLWSQVTHSSHFSPSVSEQSSASSFPYTLSRKLFFSSIPNKIVERVLEDDWSDELESELQKSSLVLTHETVIYVLKKLEKDPQKTCDFFNWVTEKNGFTPSFAIYSVILRSLVQGESMKHFWVTIRKMKEQGFCIDKETYLTILGIFKKRKMASEEVALTHFYNRMVQDNVMDEVVKKVVELVTMSAWSNEVEKELGELKVSFSDNFVLHVLKEIRGYPVKALRFFQWVGEHPGYEHSTITYNVIARILGRDGSIAEFWSMVEEMKGKGYEMDIDTYIKISRQFQKNKMLEDAVKLYEIMMDGPYKPSVQDCVLLLHRISLSKTPDLSLVFRVTNKFEAVGNTPCNKAIYDGIHRSLTSVGRFDEAGKIMESMRSAGLEPDNITYSQLVYGLCKAKRLEEACKVLDDMEACGCVPDIKTWTILIQGHCAANEVDNALICLANMMGKNCDPDADLLEVLINGFLNQERIDGAYKLLVELVNVARLVPWQATYKLVINKLLSVRKLEEALNLLNLMKKQNYPPFPEPFIEYISKFGTVEDAGEFLKSLSAKKYPSQSAYVHVFQSFFQEGREYEAKDLLYKCPHHIRKHPDICKLFGSAKSECDAGKR